MTPGIASLWGRVRRLFFQARQRLSRFEGSERYWIERYRSGWDSGAGSEGRFARFKAEFVNGLVEELGISSVIELGCGDGRQLELAAYPRYLGLDVSAEAVALCRKRFADDPTKRFATIGEDDAARERADLALSLDVIFHLVEDATFERYMERLFDAAERYVVVYSSNRDAPPEPSSPHVRHRRFTDWIAARRPDWELFREQRNPYPYRGDPRTGSFADFYGFRRRAS